MFSEKATMTEIEVAVVTPAQETLPAWIGCACILAGMIVGRPG